MPCRRMSALLPVALLVALVAGCGGQDPTPTRADTIFLQDMIPHHERAIAVARLGARDATDPRVAAFARRIVREQTPELDALRGRADDANLDVDIAAGTRMARNRITDAQVSALRALHGRAFDVRFIQLHLRSEQGAAAMARTELAHGADDPSRSVAQGNASAPTSEIPELRALLAAIR